jgi:glycosyltransferase involved in cell wall biosynthesis
VRVLVAIPALNEEKTVGWVVRQTQAAVQADVLVVDDDSSDSTVEVARAAGAAVLTMPFNVGVGGAMRVAFCYALRNRYDAVVQVDADGQHDPAQIPALLSALDAGAAVAVGSRFEKGFETTRTRRFAMRGLAWGTGRLTKTHLTDTTSGFRAVDRRAVELFARRYPVEYLGDTVGSLVVAADAGLPITEVSVKISPRRGGLASQGAARSVLYLGRMLMALAVAAMSRKRGSRP